MFLLERNDDHARLTLSRPEARNAIPAAGWTDLAAKIDIVARSDVKLLVVTGAGGSFCAGADLADFTAMRRDPEAVARFRADMRAALDALAALPMPTLALVEGHCYGAGVALAMACDIRVAANLSEFAITPAKLGISYPREDVARLVSLVGPGQAARLLFTADRIDGHEAWRIGLVEYHGPAADGAVAAIAANDPTSLAALKAAISGRDPDPDARFDALIRSETMAARLEALRRK